MIKIYMERARARDIEGEKEGKVFHDLSYKSNKKRKKDWKGYLWIAGRLVWLELAVEVSRVEEEEVLTKWE